MVDFVALEKSGGKVGVDGLVVVAGPPGVGKSTLLSQDDDAIFLSCDKGLGFLETRHVVCDRWEDLKAHSLALSRQVTNGDFKAPPVMVIDTADAARDLMLVWAQGNKPRATLEDHGKVLATWKKFVGWCAELPFLVVFLAHTEVRESVGEVSPASVGLCLSANLSRALTGRADLLLIADFGKRRRDGTQERVLRMDVAGDAKDRTGRFPSSMPLDWALVKDLMMGEPYEPEEEEFDD